MKCFIDPVVYFIIVIMMPDGVLGKKKKSTDFHLHHYNPESLCPLLRWGSALFQGDMDWQRVSGRSYQGAILDRVLWILSCQLEHPHEIDDLGDEVQAIFSGRKSVQQAQEAGLGRCTQTLLIQWQGIWSCVSWWQTLIWGLNLPFEKLYI